MIHWYGRPWFFEVELSHITPNAWVLVWDIGPFGGVIRLGKRP